MRGSGRSPASEKRPPGSARRAGDGFTETRRRLALGWVRLDLEVILSLPILLVPFLLSGCVPLEEEEVASCLEACAFAPDGLVQPPGVEISVETVPTVLRIEWDSPAAGISWVDYGLDGALDHSTPLSLRSSTHHHHLVAGLKAGRKYTLRAVVEKEDGELWQSDLGCAQVEPPPNEMARFDVKTTSGSESLAGGYLLLTQVGQAWANVQILDRDGDVVWYQATEPRMVSFTAAPSLLGPGFLWLQEDNERGGEGSAVWRSTLDGVGDSITHSLAAHHDFAELPDGRLATITREQREVEVDGVPTEIWTDSIWLYPEGNTDPEVGERLFDFYEAWEHPVVLAPDTGPTKDWTHSNSLIHVDNAFYLMSRNLDTLLKIDARSGELLWTMGAPHSDFTSQSEDPWWHHAHLSDLWDGGMVLFDNGKTAEVEQSRIVKYSWDEESRTVDIDWEYVLPKEDFVQAGGDVKRLPDGTYISSYSTLGTLVQLSPDGEELWRAELPVGAGTGRVSWLADLYELY